MSGPQGHDPNQPWSSGQQPPQAPGPEEQPSPWQQPPAYSPPPQPYPQGEQYPPAEPYPGSAPQYQQPYPPGQYQPGQYPAPGTQFGDAPIAEESAAAKGSKRSVAVLGTILGVLGLIIVAVVLVLGFWKPGFFVTTKLNVDKAQAGVQQILSDQVNGYGVKNVKDVKCNKGENPTVKKGETFSCDASVDGQHKQVTVTFQDDSGTYEVGRPTG